MMVKLYQINYPNARGSWVNDDEDFTEYEEVKVDFNIGKEEPNYFQTGRFLKRIINDDWFYELRTNKRFTMEWFEICRTKPVYTQKWGEDVVDALMDSKWKDHIAREWRFARKRAAMKGYLMGILKDTGVIKGSYDSISMVAHIINNTRTFSRYMSLGKKQPYYSWLVDHLKKTQGNT